MPEVEEKVQEQVEAPVKKKSKKKGKKAGIIVLCCIVVLAVASALFIHFTTLPKQDMDENMIPVGGMVVSDTYDYQTESGNGIRHNPIIRIMQMVWRFCASGDAAKHAVQTPPENVVEFTYLPYVEDDNIYHRLDVYYPNGTKPGDELPVIIDIHGGGWMYGDKNLNEYYCLALASRGYVVFNISYRLVPDVTVNEQLQDCALALQWISQHFEDYPCNPNNIMLTGDSAGGMLAVYSAVLLQSPELRETFDVVDGNMNISALLLTSPVAFMKDGGAFSVYTKPMWGSDYDDKPTANYMDLDSIISFAQLPPTYLITSDGDSLAHEQTHRAYDLLIENGVDAKLADYEMLCGKKQPHVFSVLNPFDEAGTTAITSALGFYKSVIDE